MKKFKKLIFPVITLVLLAQPSFVLAKSTTLKSIQDGSHSEISIAVAKELNSSTNSYVITTSWDYPDALAGTVLASKHNAPILYVLNGGNNQAVFNYLKENNANSTTEFYILGGPGAVSYLIENDLRKISDNIVRLGGFDRYDTVDLINTYLNPKAGTPVILATGLNYPDALSMGAVGGQLQYPIFLVDGNSIPQSAINQLKKISPSTAYIAGGTGAVSSEIENQIKKLTPGTIVRRLGGIDRYETSKLIADWFSSCFQKKIYTTGADFHSALVAAPLASLHKASIILVDDLTSTQLAQMNQQDGYIIGHINGGTLPEAITSLSESDIKKLQSYDQLSLGGLGGYTSFEDVYNYERENADALIQMFLPSSLSAFENTKVDWITSPRLVYVSALTQWCIRGILTITPYGNNSFKLDPNVPYQCDVEFRLRYSLTNGQATLKLEDTKYLSNWVAVSLAFPNLT